MAKDGEFRSIVDLPAAAPLFLTETNDRNPSSEPSLLSSA
jgi:hypothetical protein